MLTKYYDSVLRPFDAFDTLRLFDDLHPHAWGFRPRSNASSYRTNATEKGFELSLDLPGVKAKDVSIQVSGGEVTVSGKSRDGDFKHTYRLSKEYDVDAADATLEDGVLTVSFKRRKEDVRIIEVKTR